MAKQTFHVEYIRELLSAIAEFNSHDLKDIVLLENGKPLAMSDEMLDRWRFIGMSNQSFVEFEFWNDEAVEPGEVRG